MNQCHGCKGLGWVDSQHVGPTKCPVCGGKGQINDLPSTPAVARSLQPLPPTPSEKTIGNRNRILGELENWLQQDPNVRLDHGNKRMNTYRSWSQNKVTQIGLVWVYTDGANRIHLRKGDYSQVDTDKRVINQTSTGQEPWGGYPQFIIRDSNDLAYAKKLIEYARRSL